MRGSICRRKLPAATLNGPTKIGQEPGPSRAPLAKMSLARIVFIVRARPPPPPVEPESFQVA
jgi:hypothetical protein